MVHNMTIPHVPHNSFCVRSWRNIEYNNAMPASGKITKRPVTLADRSRYSASMSATSIGTQIQRNNNSKNRIPGTFLMES